MELNNDYRIRDFQRVQHRVPKDLIFLGYRGSQSHGTWLPKASGAIDDIDLMGVYVAPREHYIGFGRNEVVESFIDDYDIVSYELRKFVSLLLKNNPNVLSMLWLEPKSILEGNTNYYWQELVSHRQLFVSKLAYHSFSGYAYGQLKKMTAFNEKEQERVKKMEEVARVNGITFSEEGVPKLPPGASREQIECVRQIEDVRKKYFSGYMGEKRKQNVIKFGYDTKNAAHLIRLLRMCTEFLQTGEFLVDRPDANFLKAVKQGQLSLVEVQEEANKLFQLAEKLKDASKFPDTPDKEKIEALLIRLLDQYFQRSST